MTEFIIDKREGLHVGSLPGGMGPHAGDEESPVSFSISSGLGDGEDLGRLEHTLMLILRYPKSMWEEISTLSSLTKDLQL
jgi:hypothetical protein